MKTTQLASYIETALWSNGGDHCDITDFAPVTVAQCADDLTSFLDEVAGIAEGFDECQLAHDFWLTRNRHGAGFWDGDYPEDIGKRLTDIAHSYGECNLYVGDDGKVYIS